MSHPNHPKHVHEKSSATPATSVARDSRKSEPTEARIRLRAYEISQARNGGPGDAMADWIQAEREAGAGRDANR